MPEETTIPEPLGEEALAALRAAPVASNRFYGFNTPGGGLRLAFGETLNGATFYHQAVCLSAGDVVELRDFLLRLYPVGPV